MNSKKSMFSIWKRLLSYIVGHHKLVFGAVLVCILISSCTVVVSSLFLEILIDDYITPMLVSDAPVFDGLLRTILFMAVIYLFGTLCTFLYNRLMIKISQGALKEIRDDMFEHMQKLPIRYFDTHTHGDIMSHYTNDTDTLRQFISQALPQLISAVITIVVILISMFMSSVPLTILVLIFTALMILATQKVGGKSARYFIRQQKSLADVNGYVEEMINGQKIAFVGSTGAGKTTITNLLNRFYDIADGKIRYDGINISKIRKPDLRRSLGVVLQDVNLFTGTIMDNIRYGRLDATDEECIAAAKLTNAHDFISRLPDGYQTMLTQNGASLSQGQRQLISIARAAVADPPVMVLDEATSSIDTRTEALVQKGMDNLMTGRTVFVIAHRLSTVRNSDAIMVLEQGRIIERGSHDKLIDDKGVYYRLYTGAFELE